MTKEKLIRHLKYSREIGANYLIKNKDVDEIIKVLEQEPCEDAISRQAVLELVADYDLSMGQVVKGIHTLPPVNPQPKTGHWIDEFGGCECSECGCLEGGYSDYCPNCGAKMQEVKE